MQIAMLRGYAAESPRLRFGLRLEFLGETIR
jgi:hypothetical protein